MFTHILAPVDLAHVERLGRALEVAADLARHYDIPVTYVGVTTPQPGTVAHNPEEFARKLDSFVAGQTEEFGHVAQARTINCHDPAVELDHALLKVVKDLAADLVVMGSHVPGWRDYVSPSHGGKLALHSHASIMLVRDHDR
ncbi:nucleotide-binding universal stress UspA family protein [Rhodovulum bhavnagarense]|uniref:Nucleotide-binding universal stress UspA family protein n=1 Tax=Rhodovulum bhavnagarense TaxID=992286 RepID=A0A4R2RDK1_9RHOB|nr:universal stress protein [Rhodovulum bhavnagarense]TCP60584.1 nucleotide-binding universal stress UspA family protein [Rhodovulum bhavnagarense]